MNPSEKNKSEMAAPPEINASAKEKEKAPSSSSRNQKLFWLTSVLLAIAIAWLLYWFFYLQYYEYTDDAYANGNMVNVNSAISSSTIAFFADDTDLVMEGMLLVQLDPTEYLMKYEKELAALASETLQVSQLYDRVLANQANVQSKQTAYEKAKYDYQNRLTLIDSKAISNEDFIHSRDDLKVSEANLNQAKYDLQVSLDAAGNTSPQKHPRIEEQKARVRIAYYQLKHTSVYAPTTGYIAQRNVEVGQWVTPGANLMAIIPTDYVWVDANFKETQLTYMRIGQPATVWLDIYGSNVRYEGKVLGIASGTGSIFSIIPPQNATGNWIKIVQRLPVRISLDPQTVKKFPTRLGLSAEVNVDITNQDLPMLAVSPPAAKPISKTQVFDIDYSELNQMLDTLVEENLNEQQRNAKR